MKQKVTEDAVLVNALQGGLLPEDISVIQAELQKIDTELVVHEYPSYAINGIEIFFPQIQLFYQTLSYKRLLMVQQEVRYLKQSKQLRNNCGGSPNAEECR